MARNPNRWPHTPEGLAAQARNMTKNAQPVGGAQHRHGKLFTKEKFLEDRNAQNNEESQKKTKRVGPHKVRTKTNLDNIAKMLLEYSHKKDSYDMHDFLAHIDMSPQNFLRMTKVDENLFDVYERAKSNFARNHLAFLYATVNTIALGRSAYMHGVYSHFMNRELRKEKKFEKKIAASVIKELNEQKKELMNESPPRVIVEVEY